MTTIEVKNDYMLGRQNENILYYKCMELQQENKQLKEEVDRLKENVKQYIYEHRLYQQELDNYKTILTELEDYLNQKMTQQNLYDYQKLAYQDIYLRIKRLKEKYK